jgi:endonuclease/exonuclease/phosphatase (EEP) superfamily protein YafD
VLAEIGTGVTAFIAVLIIFVSYLPLSRSSKWWIRGWDYPRPQLLIMIVILVVLWIIATGGTEGWPLVLTIALVGTGLYHAWRILPMTPPWPNEVALAEDSDVGRRISVLSCNVLMENRDASRLKSLIAEHKPDVVLLLETDQWWTESVMDLGELYETVHALPQDNHYGMMFMTNLDEVSFAFHDLVEEDVPSVEAKLRLPCGAVIRFFGLHPRPPTPGVDTDQRDAELIVVARRIEGDPMPVIVAGDLNDVAWSHTTRLFRRISHLLDPRIGRGFYSTFDATRWYMRWPLDHLFHSNDFLLRKLACLPHIGSDHYPYLVELCLTPGASKRNAAPDTMTDYDAEDADQMVRKGRLRWPGQRARRLWLRLRRKRKKS